MDSGPAMKSKVTVKFNQPRASPSSRPPSRSNVENIPSRPASPSKLHATVSPTLDSSPTFRPKAKVNSSATTRKTTGPKLTVASSSTSTTPRAGSPAKFTPRVRNGITSPTHTPKVPSTSSSRGTLRSPPPTVAASATTEQRNRSLTTTSSASSSIGSPEDTRSRTGSMSSLHHAVSFSSFHPTPLSTLTMPDKPGSVSAHSSPRLMTSRSAMGVPEREMTSSPTPRIRSKVTTMAKPSDPTSPPATSNLAPSPVHPSTRTANIRVRTASVSSNASQQQQQQQPQAPSSPPQLFYPITTAVPAANPHRYASTRPPPTRTVPATANQIFQSFSQKPSTSPRENSPSPRNRIPSAKVNGIQAKVDPASIPLPPNSPPGSAVSFSSRSSVSRSSASVSGLDDGRPESQSTSTGSSRLSPASTQHEQAGNIDQLKTTLGNLLEYTSALPSAADDSGGGSDGEVMDHEEHKVKLAAKSNRKIADLEITNRSLLTINASLEATKHRQAKEIRELKRKLRESRLILPPRAFRAVKSSLEPAEIADDEEDDDDPDDDDAVQAESEKDQIYQRVKLMIDNLVVSAQRALEKTSLDFPEGAKGTAKVLTAEEVRDWHGLDGDDDHNEHEGHGERLAMDRASMVSLHYDHDDDISLDADVSFDESTGNTTLTSEDEVAAMALPTSSAPSSPPPIFIVTKPS